MTIDPKTLAAAVQEVKSHKSPLVDHVTIATSFTIASLVSVFLVVSYARLFVGWRFALVEMGLSQIIYLVLFSMTFFWEGYTGLSIAIGVMFTSTTRSPSDCSAAARPSAFSCTTTSPGRASAAVPG